MAEGEPKIEFEQFPPIQGKFKGTGPCYKAFLIGVKMMPAGEDIYLMCSSPESAERALRWVVGESIVNFKDSVKHEVMVFDHENVKEVKAKK